MIFYKREEVKKFGFDVTYGKAECTENQTKYYNPDRNIELFVYKRDNSFTIRLKKTWNMLTILSGEMSYKYYIEENPIQFYAEMNKILNLIP